MIEEFYLGMNSILGCKFESSLPGRIVFNILAVVTKENY
jgi:hypothetical protein